jgi:ATP-binding cassette subfamily B protein RaxB
MSIRVVLQAEAGECGLACLAMVLSAQGPCPDLSQLRQRFAPSLRGATLRELIDCAGRLGFASRALRLELDELAQLRLPCILHWDLNHFVVLKAVRRREAIVLDPAVGERRLRHAELGRHFTGVALELTPTADFQPLHRPPRVRLAQLAGRVHGLGASLAAIVAVAVVLELFVVAAPLLNQGLVDHALPSNDRDLLTVLVLGFGLLLLVQTAIALARSWMVLVLGQTLALQWAANVFAHLVRLPVDFFERRHLGDIVSRFGAVGAMQRTVTGALIEALLDGLMAIAALTMMLVYAPPLAAISCAAVLAYGVLRAASYRGFREAAAQRMVLAAKENTYFLETLRAIATIKLFGREQDRRARWQNLAVDVQNRDTRTAAMNVGFNTANRFIFGLENLLVLWLGVQTIMDAQSTPGAPFTIGMLFAYTSYKGQFTGRVAGLIDHGIELKMLGLHAERLSDIVLTAPERDRDGGPQELGHLEPTLQLRQVSFRHADTEPWILRGADFTVGAGESVAITGASGVGKTTVLKLMLGLLPPTEGEVLYGGVPLRRLGLAGVRMQVGTVMQDDVLLTGSLADNISFFDADTDPQRIEACARLAQVHEDIVNMPMGYQTLVGDLGSGLSGGQRQRVLLARALYKQPRVLALDEATSHLDVVNERSITQALANMKLTRLDRRPPTRNDRGGAEGGAGEGRADWWRWRRAVGEAAGGAGRSGESPTRRLDSLSVSGSSHPQRLHGAWCCAQSGATRKVQRKGRPTVIAEGRLEIPLVDLPGGDVRRAGPIGQGCIPGP